MSNFAFWQRWLLGIGLVIAGFGAAMALVSGTLLFDLFNRLIDPAFWDGRASDPATRQFQQWIYGVWGATIAGWGIFVTFIARYPFKRKESWAWDCLVYGLLVWFILDTSLSVAYGVYFNVVFNVGLLIMAILPAVFTRREFK